MAHATRRHFGNHLPDFSRTHRAKGKGSETTAAVVDPERLLDAVSRHAAICVTDSRGILLQVDEGMFRLTGYTPDELLGRSYGALVFDEDGKRFERTLWRTLAAGRSWTGPLRLRSRQREELWVELSATPVDGVGGEECHVFVHTDITSFKRVEAALQASEDRHRGLLEQANDAILLVDMDGWVVAVNRRAEEITGYSREELLNLHMQQLVPEGLRHRLLDLHQEVLEKRRDSFRGGVLLRKDDKTVPVDLSCAVIESGGQRVIQSILHDITERKKMEAELIRARVSAERANRAKSEFISRISHELRTPLNAILGFAQLLESDQELPLAEPHREEVRQILNAGWHLLELIDDILSLSSIESGGLRVAPVPVPVAALLQECRDLLEPLAKERNVTLALMPVPDDLLLLADRTRLKEVLLNLGSNAIKYNKINGCVSYSVVVEAEKVRINVSDTGIGIRPEKMQHLFEPFERLGQEDGNVHGSGLGLVIARRLTELMGGQLGVWSEFGVGSTFWVDLPRVVEVS